MRAHNPKVPLRSLRLLGLLSIAVPLLLYALFAAYQLHESGDAAELRISRSLRVAHEHAGRVLGSAESLQSRVADQVGGKPPAQLRGNQAALHAMLVDAARGQPQIQSIWIIGADGKPIASSLFFPAPESDYSDRPYFKFHAASRNGTYLSPPLVTRTTGERILDLSVRFDDETQAFGGVINVSLRTSYFEQFYGDLVADEPGLAVNMFHRDGAIYTRWPLVRNAPERLPPESSTMKQIEAGHTAAQVRGISSIDGQDRLVAYKQVGNYPLFVGTGMNLTVQRNEVLRDMGILFLLGMPPFVALYFAARMALRRTREAIESAESLERETLTRRRAEEALLQAQKLEALGRLTGGVAHDFNNALMVISNNLFLLRRNLAGAGERQLDSIGRAVDSATKLTRQLLAFSRRQALVPEHIRLQDTLPAAKDLIAPVMGSQIQVSVDVAPDTLGITVDQAELELALLNLGINARDAMPSGGSLAIRAGNATGELPPPLKGSAVLVEVNDTGSGIDPAVLDKVFEPFFTTKPVGQGTGLGLSQVYGLCLRAGGTASIHSVQGSGTSVRLYFPAAPPGASPGPQPPRQADRPLGKTVLLVEDNNDVADALVLLLQALGCSVTRVDRTAAARAWLAAEATPDLVLSDVVMPGEMDGVGLARHLRETRPTLPVLLMTGYAEQMESITRLGFEVLPKPCTADMLAAAISRVTSSPG